MSDDRKNSKPSHIAYQVRETEGGDAYFNRVGSAFKHKDGKGFNVVLDAVPVNGVVTLRTPKDRLDEMRGEKEEPEREERGNRSRSEGRGR